MDNDVFGDLDFPPLQMLKSMRSGFVNVAKLVGDGFVMMLFMMLMMGHILDIL